MGVSVGDDLALQRSAQGTVLLGPDPSRPVAIAEHDDGRYRPAMTTLRVSTPITSRPARAWEAVADLAGHVEWMADAVAIRFLTDQRRGVGTAFECDTKVGPFVTVDHMRVLAWDEGRSLTVEHVGLIRGTGVLSVEPSGDGAVVLWEERLRFPWWLGGPVAALAAGLILRPLWRGNLKRLRRQVESTPPPLSSR